jgi:hypothetical protein
MRKYLKVKVPNLSTLHCPYCWGEAYLRDNSIIYGKPLGSGKSFICENFPHCNTYVGTHRGRFLPFGTLANRELRELRIKCHEKFDKKWMTGKMKRIDAYRWLSRLIEIPESETHIGSFTVEQCRRFLGL